MYQVSGKVIHGDHYGKQLGFPTANLDRRDYSWKKLKIRLGVYAGTVKFKIQNSKFKIYPAGIVIGPLDKHHLPKIEAHLVGFEGNLYGRKIILHLVKYLRPFRKFGHKAELKAQIKKDIARIKKIINF